MVRMDMRYMWSAMDSQLSMPKRRQPARLVVLRRSSRWKKGMGDDVFSAYLGRMSVSSVKRQLLLLSHDIPLSTVQLLSLAAVASWVTDCPAGGIGAPLISFASPMMAVVNVMLGEVKVWEFILSHCR